MTFLNPAVLFGLFSVLLPIAIHLLSKPRLRRIKWAASKFLIQSVQKNRRRVQMEDLILLILRTLLVALLVLIFARPAWLTDATGLLLGHDVTDAVIVVDNTASMGQSDGVKTRFDQAKSMVDDILGSLPEGSKSALYLVSDHAKPIIPKPTEDFAVLRRSMDQANLTDGGGDLYPGLKAAVDVLKNDPSHHRDIFVLTDSQVPAWSELTKIRELQDQYKKDITMHFMVVGDKGEDNVAVSKLELGGTVAAINQPLRCTVTVSNWGRSPATKIPVKLAADNDAPQDEGLIDEIDPGTSKNISLVARFRDAGYHSITASIAGDRLPADNQRTLAVFVIDQIHALVVEGTNTPYYDERDGFFLSHALVPVSRDQQAQYYVKVTVGHPSDLESSSLNQYELVFLSNVAQLTPRGSQGLRQYVNQGGALIVFTGPTTSSAYYNTDPDFSMLMPAKLGPAQDATSGSQKYLSWQSKNYEHPVTTLWNLPESGNLGSVRTTRYFPLTVKPATSAPTTAPAPDAPASGATPAAATAPSNAPQIVVKYNDGEPAVVEQSVGKGKVFLFSSSATTGWTSLPIHPSFVPLLIRIMSYATNALGGTMNIAPGQAYVTEVDSEYAGRDVSVLRPGEKKPRIAAKADAGEHSATIHYSDTEQAGPYQLFIGTDDKPKVVFAVQGDPTESNLAQEPKDEIATLINSGDQKQSGDTSNTATPQAPGAGRKVPGKELWLPLAIAALLLAIVEMALAHLFSQSK